MPKFPSDAPKAKVLQALALLGFTIVREGNHISLERVNPDGTKTPLTLPNHRTLKGPTLRAILTQTHISREDFLAAYDQA